MSDVGQLCLGCKNKFPGPLRYGTEADVKDVTGYSIRFWCVI